VKRPTLASLAVAILGVACAVVCLSPLYTAGFALKLLAMTKLGALIGAAVCSWSVWRSSERGEPQRPSWRRLALGLSFYSGGQTVLAFHQIVFNTAITFPSFGDPLFVIATVFDISALFGFCIAAARSGLPLGRPAVFWSPVALCAVALAAGSYSVLSPVVQSSSGLVEALLNVYYPVSSLIALGPCLIMLGVAMRFRGGRLLLVWLPLTVGFALVLASDVMFAYVSTASGAGLEALMDLAYALGYLLVLQGAQSQRRLVRST